MSGRAEHAVQGGGRNPELRIVPLAAVIAGRPDCEMCTWGCRRRGQFELRFISRACLVHGRLECLGA